MEEFQIRVSVTEKSFTIHAELMPQLKYFTADINTPTNSDMTTITYINNAQEQ